MQNRRKSKAVLLLADGFEDAHPRLLLDALGKRFLLAFGLLLRRRLIARHTVVNGAFLGLAEIQDAASTLAVNENGGFRVGALPFCFGLPVLPFKRALKFGEAREKLLKSDVLKGAKHLASQRFAICDHNAVQKIGLHLKLVMRTTSPVSMPRANANCLPSRANAKLKIYPEVKWVNC
jgi:hypothetical protein